MCLCLCLCSSRLIAVLTVAILIIMLVTTVNRCMKCVRDHIDVRYAYYKLIHALMYIRAHALIKLASHSKDDFFFTCVLFFLYSGCESDTKAHRAISCIYKMLLVADTLRGFSFSTRCVRSKSFVSRNGFVDIRFVHLQVDAFCICCGTM